jgi:hypothetical protein
MDVVTPVVQDFFDQYARSRSAMDVDRIVSQYADLVTRFFLRFPAIGVAYQDLAVTGRFDATTARRIPVRWPPQNRGKLAPTPHHCASALLSRASD